MAEAATKLPVKTEAPSTSQQVKVAEWRPFDTLRNQVDRLFRDFENGFLQTPFYRDIDNFFRRDAGFGVTPAIDIAEKDKPSRSRPSCRDLTPRISTFSCPTAS